MRHLTLADLRKSSVDIAESYVEFLRTSEMSSGLYVLDAGEVDPQHPHREDEIYVVLSGTACFTGGDETATVGPGSVIFVPALEEHRFHDITERLEVVVVFAPAETE